MDPSCKWSSQLGIVADVEMYGVTEVMLVEVHGEEKRDGTVFVDAVSQSEPLKLESGERTSKERSIATGSLFTGGFDINV